MHRFPDRKGPGAQAARRGLGWHPQQDSNLYLNLRRILFYPLNYGGRDQYIIRLIIGRTRIMRGYYIVFHTSCQIVKNEGPNATYYQIYIHTKSIDVKDFLYYT